MAIKFSNNASATLSSAIPNTATTITVASGQGALFPVLGAGDYFYASLVDTSNNIEIVKCTARNSDTLTVARGQDGTVARAYIAGDKLELRPVAAGLDAKLDKDGSVAMTGALPMGGNKITGVADPTTAQDAATKNYTDTQVSNEATARANAVTAEANTRSSADTTLQNNINAEATARANADALKLDKSGGTMTGQLIAPTVRSNGSAGDDARNTGFQASSGQDIGECNRWTQYYDDRAANCNGYLPNGNCAGNSTWNPPNGNWWTWGVSGVATGNCGNPWGYDFAGGQSNTLFAVSVGYNYDGYYLAANEIGGDEYRRNYRNCNCGQCINNCYTNCNCNCACDCACQCQCK